MTKQFSDRELSRAQRAVHGAFVLNGSMAAFLVRIPEIKEMFALSNAQLGMYLLASAFGVLVALKPAGVLVAKKGSSRITLLANAAIPVAVVTLGLLLSPIWWVLSMFFAGYVFVTHDIAMNAHAALLERLTNRSLMNGFHARYSIGALIGSAFGGLCAQLDISILQMSIIIAVIAMGFAAWMRSSLLAADTDIHELPKKARRVKRPRIFLILGALGLFSTLAEGAAADWGGVLLKEQWQTSPFVTSLPYIFFSATMVVGRLTGDRLTDRFGRSAILKAGGLTSGLGLLLGLIIGGPFGITLGWALLGAGVSVAIPTVFSATAQIASTEHSTQISPAQAVAGVSGIAYAGFLLGPPLIGVLAEFSSLRVAMVLPALLTLGLVFAAPFIKSSES